MCAYNKEEIALGTTPKEHDDQVETARKEIARNRQSVQKENVATQTKR